MSNLLLALSLHRPFRSSRVQPWMGSSEVIGLDEFASESAEADVLLSEGTSTKQESSKGIHLKSVDQLLADLDETDDVDAADGVDESFEEFEDFSRVSSSKAVWGNFDDRELMRPNHDDKESALGESKTSDKDTIGVTLELLEWDRLSKQVASQADTTLGKEILEAGLPVRLSREESETLQIEMEEAIALAARVMEPIDLRRFHNLRPYVTYASKGGVLGELDLIGVADSLEAAHTLISSLRQFNGKGLNLLPSYFDGISSDLYLRQQIVKAISERGEVLDSADPQLSLVREQARMVEHEVRTQLKKVAAVKRKYLASSQPMFRNDRQVLLVVAKQKHHVRGTEYGASSSGSSLYIEPKEVADLNSRLSRLRSKERKLVRKVLARLSGLLGHADTEANLLALADKVTKVDCAIARARFSVKLNGQPLLFRNANMSDQGLRLLQLRHPLMVWPSGSAEPNNSLMRPMDVIISSGVRSVVITGPNTGGKTVILKSLGLAALMAKAGLRVLCEPEDVKLGKVVVPFFDAVMADIGDDQSITQSLSTFSAHVNRIQRILTHAAHLESRASLVLLDEVGSGTDPTEGSALGMAVLRQLTQDAALTLSTTHHNRLKTLKYSDMGHFFENACVEFDVSSMAPTYQVLWGVPGQSNALSIAERLGLHEHIVKDARALLSEDSEDRITLESAIADLQAERKKQQQLNAELQQAKTDAEKERATLRKQTANNIKYEIDIRKQSLEKVEAETEAMRKSMRQAMKRNGRDSELSQVQKAEQNLRDLKSKLGDVVGTVPLRKFVKNLANGNVDPEEQKKIGVGDYVSASQLFGKLYPVEYVTGNRLAVKKDRSGTAIKIKRSEVTRFVTKSVQLDRVKKSTLDLGLLYDSEALKQPIHEACVLNTRRGTLWIRARNTQTRQAICEALEKEKLVDWYEEIFEQKDRMDQHQKFFQRSSKPSSPDVWIRAHLRAETQ